MKIDPLTKLCPTCRLPLAQHQVRCPCQRGKPETFRKRLVYYGQGNMVVKWCAYGVQFAETI